MSSNELQSTPHGLKLVEKQESNPEKDEEEKPLKGDGEDGEKVDSLTIPQLAHCPALILAALTGRHEQPVLLLLRRGGTRA